MTSYKLVYLARRAASVTREDWPRTWKSHAVFASQFPALEATIAWIRYCNRIDAPTLVGEPIALPAVSSAHDGVAVAAASTLAGLNGAGIGEADRARVDVDELRVFDMLTPNFTYYCIEDVAADGPLGEVAVFRFVPRAKGLDHAEFDDRWSGPVTLPAGATRYVRNRPVHAWLPLFAFDGIAECWFASAEDAVRALSRGQLAQSDPALATIGGAADTVTMLTRVCHRWPRP